jgi:hypothetical protein
MEERDDRRAADDFESRGERREAAADREPDEVGVENEDTGVETSPEDESVSQSRAEGFAASDDVDRPDDTVEAGEEASEPMTSDTEATASETLLAPDATVDFRSRWKVIQTAFVDEPRRSVEEANALVAELMERLAESFSDERNRLENQWDRGDEVSTEELRVTLQRYRAFFNRLLET